MKRYRSLIERGQERQLSGAYERITNSFLTTYTRIWGKGGEGGCFMDKVKENISSLIPLKAGDNR